MAPAPEDQDVIRDSSVYRVTNASAPWRRFSPHVNRMTGRIKHYSAADVLDGGLQQRRISSSFCSGIKEVEKRKRNGCGCCTDVLLSFDDPHRLLSIATDCWMDNELIDPQFPHRRSSALEDVTIATFLDVAVVRCLFMPRWSEEGVHWALQFLFYRSVTAGHLHVAVQLIRSFEQVARDQRRNAFQMSSAQKKQFPAGAQDRSVALLGRQN